MGKQQDVMWKAKVGLLMTFVTKVISRVDVVHPNDFLTLAIDCQDHRIKVCLID